MRAKPWTLALLALTAALAPARPATAAPTEVAIAGFAFSPDPLPVAVGTTVRWTNDDSAPHTVTADDGSFNSGTRSARGTFEHTFGQAGTFTYFCAIHPSMRGTVQVGGATPTTAPTTTTTVASTTTTTAAPTTTTTAAATTTSGSPPTTIAGVSGTPTTAGFAPPTARTKPAAPSTTATTAAPTTTGPTAAPTPVTTLPPAAPTAAAAPQPSAVTTSTPAAAGTTGRSDQVSAGLLAALIGTLLLSGFSGWWILLRRRR